jgi:hypothetical protein
MEYREDRIHSCTANVLKINAYRCEWGTNNGCQWDIVNADNGNILRNSSPRFLTRLYHAHSNQIVESKDAINLWATGKDRLSSGTTSLRRWRTMLQELRIKQEAASFKCSAVSIQAVLC